MCEIENKQKQVLLDIKSIADSLQLSIMLVGAGARVLVFDNQFKIPGRGTFDLDFAIQVNNWLDFQAFTRAMTEGLTPLFKVTRVFRTSLYIFRQTPK